MYVYPVYLHINVPTLDTSNKEDLSNILTGHWAAIRRRVNGKKSFVEVNKIYLCICMYIQYIIIEIYRHYTVY